MTSYQSMQQGIQAVQSGNRAEGERLLRYALKDPALSGRLRATALNWLAEISSNNEEKIAHFNEALSADPQNDWAEEHLAELLKPMRSPSAPPPPLTLPESENPLVVPPPPTPIYVPPSRESRPPAPPPVIPEQSAPAQPVKHLEVVGILGGPNGPGSGFFLTSDGIIVTTRYVIGPADHMTVELEAGHQLSVPVIRSFPEIDVALLNMSQTVSALAPVSPVEEIPENAPITIMSYGKSQISGRRRETGRTMAAHLFPTDIVQLNDAGGGPVFNDRQQVVGMITRNISSSSAYVYGVHMAAIRRCLDSYRYEINSVADRVYCTSCGYASAVASEGGFYCECCGTVMPRAQNQLRAQTPYMAALYGENSYTPCTVCAARVGFYEGLCLRCGQAGDPTGKIPCTDLMDRTSTL